MKKLLLALLLLSSPAFAQSVQQSGTVSARHLPYWVTSGVIGDGGSSADSPISSMGVTNNGGNGICVSSDRQTAAGRNQLCLGAQTNGAATISLQNYGTASPQNLNFVVNGVTVNLPSGPFGTMAIQNANAVAITGGTITGLPTPVNPSDVAIKSYVDAVSQGLIILAQSRLATATVLPNTPTYANGTLGVGATLTAGSHTTLTVDGSVANLNDVILVKNQAAPEQNGIYTLTTAGDGSNAWVLTRATYFDQAAEMKAGSYTFVTAGTANISTSWVLNASVATVGTSAANFNLFSSTANVVSSIGGAQGAITLGNGLAISSTTLSTGAGVDSGAETAKTANYTAASGDCGTTLYGTGGPWNWSLPSVIAGCSLTFCNNDPNDNTHHAQRLIGFPSPSFSHLWMQQCETIQGTNGVWQVTKLPGRFRPAFSPVVFIDTGGSDTNDGLISNAASNALVSVQAFFNQVKYEWDSTNLIPQGNLTSGQTFTGCPIYEYRDNGVVYLIGNGGNATLRTSCSVVVEESDFGGYIIFSNVTLDCTSAVTHPCTGLFLHQQVGSDLSNGAAPSASSVTFIGGGSSDTAIWCDAQCRINAAAAVIFGGTFKTLIALDYGAMMQLNNGVTFQNGLTVDGQGAFRAYRGSTMGLQSTMTIGTTVNFAVNLFDASDQGQFVLSSTFATTGSVASGRQWSILNNSFLCNDSATAIPGTAGDNTATAAHSAGTVIATSGDNCYPSFP